ncbi:MAG: deoxyribodipyrimidine photo-lyase [Chloroflexota bacterium]
MDPDRLTPLNSCPLSSGGVVIYWMQSSGRTTSNLALNLAIEKANELGQPVICYFAVDDSYPLATHRTFRFLLQGLRDVSSGLENRNVGCAFRIERSVQGIVSLATSLEASLVVTDESHLRLGRRRRAEAAVLLEREGIPLWGVDNDVLVPVRSLGREHYAARTIRSHLQRARDPLLQPIPNPMARVDPPHIEGIVPITDIDEPLSHLSLDMTVPPSPVLVGGERAAGERLHSFLEGSFARYEGERNDAATDVTSHLSPYLHFGHIDPWTIGLAVREADAPLQAKESFLEELLVRRELASNFTFYNPRYDRMDAIPEWARKTLREHTADPRPALYTLEELASAGTADPLWNAGQHELLTTGIIHNWVRMYWGKRIIEWTRTPEEAMAYTIHLNNLYAVDGRDPASFANIAWCFGKHDRPWPQRPIFGTVRSMTLGGARRKFDVDGYIDRVNALRVSASSPSPSSA